MRLLISLVREINDLAVRRNDYKLTGKDPGKVNFMYYQKLEELTRYIINQPMIFPDIDEIVREYRIDVLDDEDIQIEIFTHVLHHIMNGIHTAIFYQITNYTNAPAILYDRMWCEDDAGYTYGAEQTTILPFSIQTRHENYCIDYEQIYDLPDGVQAAFFGFNDTYVSILGEYYIRHVPSDTDRMLTPKRISHESTRYLTCTEIGGVGDILFGDNWLRKASGLKYDPELF